MYIRSMVDTVKRNKLGRIAFNVTKTTRARYRSHLHNGRENYNWSTPEGAREFWYQCLVNDYDVLSDIHNNVSVDISVKEVKNG